MGWTLSHVVYDRNRNGCGLSCFIAQIAFLFTTSGHRLSIYPAVINKQAYVLLCSKATRSGPENCYKNPALVPTQVQLRAKRASLRGRGAGSDRWKSQAHSPRKHQTLHPQGVHNTRVTGPKQPTVSFIHFRWSVFAWAVSREIEGRSKVLEVWKALGDSLGWRHTQKHTREHIEGWQGMERGLQGL